ncbi:MAG: hypothetical protein EOO62_08285 [Hymenobacter sp.]|nr:MAG: hypothetical protein EOO62_08285 [Hymenobacter sp.]
MNLLSSIKAGLGRWLATPCLAALAAFGSSHPATAQATGPPTIRLQPEDLERGQYGPQLNFYFLPPGQTGENYVNAGFFGQRLRSYLGSNQQALTELDKYKRQKSLFLADRVLLLGSVVAYGVQVPKDGGAQYTSPGQIAAGSTFVVSLLATLFINRHTNEYFKQAVDNYNTDLPATRRGSLRQLRPASFGLAATPQGRPVLALGWRL